MNIFTRHESIFGSPETPYLSRGLDEFFVLLNELRPKLGNRGYLLDEYVRLILEAAEYPPLHESAEAGCNAAMEMRELMSAALADRPIEHPLYEEFHEVISQYPLPYQESATRDAVYTILLINPFVEHITKSYWARLWEYRGKLDIVALRHLYDELCALLGSDMGMERLNFIIRQRFLLVTPMTGFIQGLTNSLVVSMITMDLETRRYCFELASEILNRSQD